MERGNCEAGVNQLQAFERKLRAHVDRPEPASSLRLTEAAEEILRTLENVSE